jgi:prevent-host-death family protein
VVLKVALEAPRPTDQRGIAALKPEMTVEGRQWITRHTSHLTSHDEVKMQTWPVQDAKARFSEFLDACMAEGPQMVTKRGAEAAVLLPVEEWRRLQAAARPSLKQLLLSDEARVVALLTPARGSARRRKVAAAD